MLSIRKIFQFYHRYDIEFSASWLTKLSGIPLPPPPPLSCMTWAKWRKYIQGQVLKLFVLQDWTKKHLLQSVVFLYAFISFTFQGWIQYRSFCTGRTPGALVKTIKYSKFWNILVISVCNLTLPLTLHLTLPYHTSYLTLHYLTLPYHTLSEPYIMSYIMSYLTLPYLTLHFTLPYLTLCLTLPYCTVSYHTILFTLPYLRSYLTILYLMSYLTLLYHTIPYHTIPYCTIHLTLPYFKSYLTVP